MVIEPYQYRKSTKERGDAWNKVAAVLNSFEEP